MPMKLQESWGIIRHHLEKARDLLPTLLKEDSDGGSLAEVEDFLSHNELGLAFDELEMIGMENPCPPEFWEEMVAAAENMNLSEQAEQCRAKLR
jgi:hypothetical protein